MIIKIKRGNYAPSTSDLLYVGEMALDQNNNALYVRSINQVIKIGGVESVTKYEGNVSSYRLNLNFNRDYIYKVHVVCSTNATDTSNTEFNYFSSTTTTSKSNGSYVCSYCKDNSSSVSVSSNRDTPYFYIYDGYSNTVDARYATTKVIDFEVSPTQESNTSYTYAWTVTGTSVCCASDQSNSGISMAKFSHVIDASLHGILINPGLDAGSSKTFTLSVYRMKRR